MSGETASNSPRNGRPRFEIDANRAVAYVAGSVFVAVTLWLGFTVQNMAEEVARLSVAMENQIKVTDRYDTVTASLVAELHAIKAELAQRTGDAYALERLRGDIDRLQEEVSRLRREIVPRNP